MQPSLNIGDIVLVTKTSIQCIAEGDIIAYVSKQGIVVHRVYKIVEDENGISIITKGDANEEPDNIPVYEKLIVCKAVLTVPKIGLLQLYLRDFLPKVQEILSRKLVLITSLYTSFRLYSAIQQRYMFNGS